MADLLSVGRAAFEGITRGYGRIGMSASSRQQLEGFFNNGITLFNQLYAKTENQELANQTQILALRSKYKSYFQGGVFDDSSTVAKSTTSGTNVDTEA
jgi:hypothetical protein